MHDNTNQSFNWWAKPLTSLEVVLDFISSTTTDEGLTVSAVKDSHCYPTGIQVSDEEMAALNLVHDPFHPDWNYTIKPLLSILSRAGSQHSQALDCPSFPLEKLCKLVLYCAP